MSFVKVLKLFGWEHFKNMNNLIFFMYSNVNIKSTLKFDNISVMSLYFDSPAYSLWPNYIIKQYHRGCLNAVLSDSAPTIGRVGHPWCPCSCESSHLCCNSATAPCAPQILDSCHQILHTSIWKQPVSL